MGRGRSPVDGAANRWDSTTATTRSGCGILRSSEVC